MFKFYAITLLIRLINSEEILQLLKHFIKINSYVLKWGWKENAPVQISFILYKRYKWPDSLKILIWAKFTQTLWELNFVLWQYSLHLMLYIVSKNACSWLLCLFPCLSEFTVLMIWLMLFLKLWYCLRNRKCSDPTVLCREMFI